jgi:acetolactate synthase small subunit
MRDGFDDEWLGKDVEVEQVKGVIRGRIIDVSKYWLKMVVNGQTLYVNKAYVVSIKPAEVKDTASGGGNGGERASRSK